MRKQSAEELVENDSYFADPSSSDALPPGAGPRRLSDDRGYVVRQSVMEEGTIPEYVIPVGSADGTWGMMKRLGRFRPEGWLSLWKGAFSMPNCDTQHRINSSPLRPSHVRCHRGDSFDSPAHHPRSPPLATVPDYLRGLIAVTLRPPAPHHPSRIASVNRFLTIAS